MILSFPGILNMLAFTGSGMELNLFGFIYFPIMLCACFPGLPGLVDTCSSWRLQAERRGAVRIKLRVDSCPEATMGQKESIENVAPLVSPELQTSLYRCWARAMQNHRLRDGFVSCPRQQHTNQPFLGLVFFFVKGNY
jgi:hypothetical protein